MDQVLTELLEEREDETAMAYGKAKQINDEYVERIKIFALRADDYDPKKAAARLVSFFTFKNQLFGSNKLGREILLDDLDEKTTEAFKLGGIQILKDRDRSGRTVIVMIARITAQYDVLTLSRLYYYVNMVAMRDETTRKKGVVFMLYSLDLPQDFFVQRAEKLARVLWLLPVKIVSAHYCYDGPKQVLFEKTLSTAMDSYYLCRFRSHYVGSHAECTYKLSAFGIPNFIKPDGNFDIQWIKQWIDNTKAQEKLKFGCNRAASASTAMNMNMNMKQQTFVSSDEVRSSSATSSEMMASSSTSSETMKKDSGTKQPPFQLQQPQLQPPNRPIIINPGPMDLVVRKGRYSKNSEGYKQFRSVLSNRFDEYENAGYGEKWIIADAVLYDLKGAGCRFIKRTKQPQGGDGGGGGSAFLFEECDDTESREKIGHAFRTLRKTSK